MLRALTHIILAMTVLLSLNAKAFTQSLPRITLSSDKTHFVEEATLKPFSPWGFNYLGQMDHLAEEDWHTPEGWQQVEQDFQEMKQLGANVVRWHLQVPTYLSAPDQVKPEQLARLTQLLDLAETTGLYLDLTGLNCFRLKNSPDWYDTLSEAERWSAQAFFWESIAQTCADRPVVFCYDLMNEPVIVPPKPEEHPWLTGELGGFHFVQRLTQDLDGRDQKQIAHDWSTRQVSAIRKHDTKTLTTVGVIPWAFVWPKAESVFYSQDHPFDFVSIHVYPKSGNLEQELAALKTYQIGRPLLIEETFPLACNMAEFKQFLNEANPQVNGWISHYFGSTPQEHRQGAEPAIEAVADFLEFWSQSRPQ